MPFYFSQSNIFCLFLFFPVNMEVLPCVLGYGSLLQQPYGQRSSCPPPVAPKRLRRPTPATSKTGHAPLLRASRPCPPR